MEWAGAIRTTAARLYDDAWRPPDPALGDELVAYVLEGGDDGVLERVKRIDKGLWFEPWGVPRDEHPIRDLYIHLRDAPDEVMVRWGRLLDAAAGFARLYGVRADGLWWPATVLAHVGLLFPEGELPFTLDDFGRVLRSVDAHPECLMVAAWHAVPEKFQDQDIPCHPAVTLTRLAGYGEFVARMHDRLSPMLATRDVERRSHAVDMLAPVPDDVLEIYAEQVVQAAVSGGARARGRAALLVARSASACAEHLHRVALDGKADERRHAVQLLWDTAPDEAQRELARATAGADRVAGVRALAEGFSRRTDAVPVPEVPPAAPPQWAVPWTESIEETVTGLVGEGWWRRTEDRVPSPASRVAGEEAVARVREFLVAAEPVRTADFSYNWALRRSDLVAAAVAHGLLPPGAVVKLLVLVDGLSDGYAAFEELRRLGNLLHEHQGVTLLGLSVLLEDALGSGGPRAVVGAWFSDAPDALGRDWAPDTVWPFFAAHLDLAIDYWSERRAGHSHAFDSGRIFPLVASFPETPTRLLELCYGLALGATKRDRRAAQDLLSTHPDAVRRASAALADGKGAVRSVAAEWLGRIGDRAAVPALTSAAARERGDSVRGAMLRALVELGESVPQQAAPSS